MTGAPRHHGECLFRAGWGGSKRFAHWEEGAGDTLLQPVKKLSQVRGIYRPTKRNIQILPLALPAYSHFHSWDPTAKRRCGNKEEVYNLPGSCLKWKTPGATGRERGRRLVTEDFRYRSGHTFACRDDTLTCSEISHMIEIRKAA